MQLYRIYVRSTGKHFGVELPYREAEHLFNSATLAWGDRYELRPAPLPGPDPDTF